MFFIFLHLFILAAIVQSTLRTDCYISFSNPAIYIKISHYYLNGPIYLHGSFTAYRDSNINVKRNEDDHIDLHFKRLDDECTPSILFSKLGANFKKLSISIFLRLHEFGASFAHFEYNFVIGFKTGIYEMYDQYQNFLIHSDIQDVEENYFKFPKSLPKIAHSYINSINGKHRELCVITENNRAVILKPNYNDIASYGFITFLRADFYKNDKEIGFVKYPTFECYQSETYSQDDLMFIIDENDYQINFSVVDIFFLHSKAHYRKKTFQLSNPKFYDVKNLKDIPDGYKKLFLMKYTTDKTTCPDGSEPKFYISKNNNVIYFAKVFQTISIPPLVEFSVQLPRSPFNMCGIKNEQK